jgi:CPA2 family monovalent cation:H+ antiporter-2
LPHAAASVGSTLSDLALHALDVHVVSIRRADGRTVRPEDKLRLAGGDTLVLAGLPETLALAESKLLSG